MKMNIVKRVVHKGLALSMALLLLFQTVPNMSIRADAAETDGSVSEVVIEETGSESESELTESSGEEAVPDPEVSVPTEETENPEVTEPSESSESTESTESSEDNTVSEEVSEPEQTESSDTETSQPSESDAENVSSEAESSKPETDKTDKADKEKDSDKKKKDPYALLAAAETGYVEISDPSQLIKGIPEGSTYVLTGNITMGADQQIPLIQGTLDGKGYTITLTGKPLAQTVTGTIQNLLVDGKASLQSGEGSVAGTVKGGTIQNCASTVNIDPGWNVNMGGLVGSIENGGIYNSYFGGTGKDMYGLDAINGIFFAADNTGAPAEVKNCYYTDGNSLGGGEGWNRDDPSNGKKKQEEMKTPEFVTLLNTDAPDTGYEWVFTEGGLPALTVKSDGGDQGGSNQITTAEELPAEIPEGATYELAANITLDAGQQIGLIAGTLDGKGYTITLTGKPLAQTVTGTVQNLIVDGKATPQNNEGSIAGSMNGGVIRNCASIVAIDPGWNVNMGGLVGSIENGGIYNSYFAGTGRDMFGTVSIYGIFSEAVNTGAPAEIKNCYYTEGNLLGGGEGWNRDDPSNGKRTQDEMKTPEFVALLNTDAPDTGYEWAFAEGGLPYLTVSGGAPEPSNPQINSAADLPSEIPEGTTYELAANITLDAGQQISLIAGTLDGKGYTITLTGKGLAQTVTGTIQNLKVDGKASLDNNQGSIANTLTGGTIRNCRSTVEIDPGWAFIMGGLVGQSENGKIHNSYFAGTGRDFSGIVTANGILGTSNSADAPTEIKNCYYSEGVTLSSGDAWNREDPSNGKKTQEEMKAPEFVDLLNASGVGSGYIWAVSEGNLPILVPGGSEIKPTNKKELQEAIKEAESKIESDYTKDTWAAMQEALKAAQKINDKTDASQDQVDEAAKNLRKAIDNLKSAVRDLNPVKPPKDGIVYISSQDDLANIDANDSSKFYQLTQDITVDKNFWAKDLAGVFDGNGHTITICIGNSLFNNIKETGVVQNLHVKVEGNFTNRQEFAPYAEKLDGGMIVNCISNVTGQHSAGYVHKMENGVMVNCLTMGHNRRGAFVFFQKSTDHKNTNGYKSGRFHNCYWSASNSVENITPADNLIDCEAVGDVKLRSTDFIAQLNAQKGEYGSSWGRDSEGYPYFGEDQGDCIIDGSNNNYPVQFVWHDKKVTDIDNGILELSPQMTNSSRFAGTFRLEGVPEDSKITWSCDDRSDQAIMQINEDGSLAVFFDGGGVVRAMEKKADGSEELAAEIRVVSSSREIEEFRLILDGEIITDSATVQGSEDANLVVQARYAGSNDFEPIPPYLVELISEKPEMLRTNYNTTIFHFDEPGTSKLTVREKTQKENPVSVTISVTSEYVPVKSIKPAIGGTIDIHYRNSMGGGQFISYQQSVIIDPANASNKDKFVVESSDPQVAGYSSNTYTPFKAGKVTFTAKINEGGKELTGTSDVKFVYTNPLSSVTGPNKAVTIKEGEKMTLPLTFKGQQGNRHEVSEPDLEWSFDKEGIVAIRRPDVITQVRDTGGPDDGNWVASKVFEMRALKPGTVMVTGTPVDKTGGAKPIKFAVTVTKSDGGVIGFNIDKFIKDGKSAASNYLTKNNTYRFGEEWTIYSLIRDGHALPQSQLDKYYDDVAINAHSWKANILPTEVERAMLALNILDKDITDVDGVNLVKIVCNHPDLTRQGSNALSWALIALDMKQTPIPAGMKWDRESLVAELLQYQKKSGGFGLGKEGGSSIDITAMSLQALKPYRHEPEVAAAIDKGLAYIARAAQENPNFGNAESIAQAIITLAEFGARVDEAPYGDSMENLMSALSGYMVPGKGFMHDKNGKIDKMVTSQALQALTAYERFLNGESGYWDLTGNSPDKDPAETVSEMIANLPDKISVSDADSVKAARKAYDALTDSQKKRVKNYDKLKKAEEMLKDALAVQKVIDAIDALPQQVTLNDAANVKKARDAFNKLSAGQQKQVLNIDKLKAAEEQLKKLADPASVMEMIDSLPKDISLSDKNAVEAARAAFEILDKDQQEQVTNIGKLEAAEKKLEDLSSAAKVQKVIDAIDALPKTVSLKDEKAIAAARAAYEKLDENQKKLVKNYSKLTKAEKSIKDLKAAAKVDKKIASIPDPLTVADEDIVKSARSAYNALTSDQKALVKNINKLKAAEKEIKDLKAAQQVMAIIKKLPTDIGAEDEKAVRSARKAYDKLSSGQKKLVKNLYILERAEKALAEKLAVKNVEDAINALPSKISKDDADAVKAARAAYNKLTPEQREQVSNIDKLRKAEKSLNALRRPGSHGHYVKESNMIEAVVENGKVSANQLKKIQNKDMILRIKGTMETGEEYQLTIYGKDIENAEDLQVQINRKGLYEKEIGILSENAEVFRFLETGKFPVEMMVEIPTKLTDGDYLLLHYDPVQQRASLVSPVKAEDGMVKFIASEGGEYFLAKKASSKSVSELEKKDVKPLDSKNDLAEADEAQTTDTQGAEIEAQTPQQDSGNGSIIWICILAAAIVICAAVVIFLVLKKRKENNGE